MSAQLALALPSAAPSNTVVINARCSLRVEADQRVIVVAGLPVHHYCAGDAVAEAYAMVFLIEAGFAQQAEVARAFERSERRYQQRYAQGGMAALGRPEGWRHGRRRIRSKRLRTIERLKNEGLSNRAIAQRLGVSEMAIRKLVGASQDSEVEQLALSAIASAAASEPASPTAVASAEAGGEHSSHQPSPSANDPAGDGDEVSVADDEPVPMSLDRDASDRTFDRQLAHLGLLDDAAPLFRAGAQVRGAGVLLALPALVESGLWRLSRKLYGEIGPAFYGLRTTLLTLLLMALSRIQRPEQLKEHDPAAFGRVLGLDRAPEVKTLRRKLTRLAAYQRAEQLGAELARLRVAQRGHLMGFLYVDGHVRAYHGQRPISQAYVARRHLAMPATTDYWVNDRAGDPLLVITGEVNAALSRAFPRLLQEVRGVVGERRVTIVFDRGGWSPKLFHQMIQNGFDILTYRKGKGRRIHARRFMRRRAKLDGRWVSYELHDQPVRFLNGKLRLRQITRLCDTGHQTQVITSRADLRDIELAYCMFERWRQENFFKYMREEFLLDALVDYRIEAGRSHPYHSQPRAPCARQADPHRAQRSGRHRTRIRRRRRQQHRATAAEHARLQDRPRSPRQKATRGARSPRADHRATPDASPAYRDPRPQ